GDLKEGPMIGTGPFIVEQIERNGTNIARRNPDYFIHGQPYIDTYQFILVADAPAILSAFRSGNVEIVTQGSLTPEEADALKRTNPGTVIRMVKALGSGNGVGLRLDRPPFNDLRVRQAVYTTFSPQSVTETA